MTAKEKRQKIIEFAYNNKQITKRQAVELVGRDYYCNAGKYVGEILSRLVNSGSLIRVKNGVFELGAGKIREQSVPENQLNLF